MADDITKKVLLKAEIEGTDAVKKLAEIKEQVTALKVEQFKLKAANKEGSEEFIVLENKIKALNTTSREYTKEIQNSIKGQNEQKGSLQSLKAELALQTAEYNKLSAAQREGAKGQELKASIKGISDELKKAEGGVGNFTRNVGDYQNQIQSALGLNKGFLGGLQNISTAAQEGGTSFAKQGVAGVQAFAKSLLSLLANPIVLIIAGITAAVVGLYKAFVSTDEGATMLASVLKALGNVMDVLLDRADSVRKMFVSIITLDFKGMKENAVDAFGGIGEAVTDAAKAGYEYEQQMDRIKDKEAAQLITNAKMRVQIEELKTASKDRTKTDEERLAASQKAMQLETELLTREKGIALENTQAGMVNLASKIQGTNMTTAQKEAALKRWLELDGAEMQSLMLKDKAFAKFYNNNEAAIQSLQKMRAADIALDSSFTQSTRRLASEDSTLRKSIIDEQTAANKKAVADRVAAEKAKTEAIKKANDEEIKLMSNTLALSVANQKAIDETRLLDENYYKQRIDYINQNAESSKAIVQKEFQFKKITAEEASVKLIEIENNRLSQERAIQDKKLSLILSDMAYEVQLAKEKAAEMLAGKKQSDSEAHLLELQRIKSDEAAQIAQLDAKLANDKSFQAEYEKQIELVRQKGRTATAIEDAKFAEKQKQLKEAGKKADLLNEIELYKNNLDISYQLKLKQLDDLRKAELEAAEKTGANVQLINDKYNKLELDEKEKLNTEKAKKVAEAAGVVADVMGELNNVLNALGEREVSDAEKKHKTKTELLDRQLKDGLISQQEHDYQVAKSEYELDKKRDQITLEAAKRAKALAIINATINAALAVITGFAQGGPILAIAAGIAGAAAIAAIIATPLPSAQAGAVPQFSDFAQTGNSGSSGNSTSDASQKDLQKQADNAQKEYDKAITEADKAKEKAEQAIQAAKDLAARYEQEAKDRADKEVQAAWEKSDKAIAEASKRADDISSQAQKALSDALSNLEKAQQNVLDIQGRIDKKALDKISQAENERIKLLEAQEKEIFDIKAAADKEVETQQKNYDKLNEIANQKELTYLELLSQVGNSGKSAEQLQREADAALSNLQSRSATLWYQPTTKAALKAEADAAQKLADKAKQQEEKDLATIEKARIDSENARIASEQAKANLEAAQQAQLSASEAAKFATMAAEERARQAAEAAKAASDAEDIEFQRKLEAAKQAEIIAKQEVEQKKLDVEQARIEAELLAKKKLDAELAAEERKRVYDELTEEKRRIAQEIAQAKADETARLAQEAANNAQLVATKASESLALALAALTVGTTGTGKTINDLNINGKTLLAFKNDGGYQSRNSDNSNGISKEDLADAIKTAVSEVKIYTTVEDIRREDKRYTEIELRSNL